LTTIVFVVVVVVSTGVFFSKKDQVLKNSLHGQISIDFDAVPTKKFEIFEVFKNGR
jgi:hypothetical protein